jgi:membrane protein YdbS with pleckstrin-like domain
MRDIFYYLLIDNTQHGPYSEEQLEDWLKQQTNLSGRFFAVAGGSEWLPVAEFKKTAQTTSSPKQISNDNILPPETTLRCSTRYLRVKLLINYFFFGVIFCFMASQSKAPHEAPEIIISLVLILALILVPLLNIWVKSMYSFKIGRTCIATKKIFTSHGDISIPNHNIQSVSCVGGVLEAFCGAGTIEISTASSDPGCAKVIWPHIPNPEAVVKILRSLNKLSN